MAEVKIPWPEWRVVRLLGRGGYGAVYEIERENTGSRKEKSALKVISIPKDDSELYGMRDQGYSEAAIQDTIEKQKEKMLREYDFMAAAASHPNIVQCYDRAVVPKDNGLGCTIYIRMELLTPLTKVVADKGLDAAEAAKLGCDMCRALDYCHSRNIIHRDVKPANIMRSEYAYKLGDFGVSRVMDHTTYATAAGSHPYMAPEVFKQESYGRQADLYSLGLVLYWLLNNRRLPFEPTTGDLTPDLVSQARSRRMKGDAIPAPLRGSAALKAVVQKACAYKPGDRYATAEEMLKALEIAERGTHSDTGESSAYDEDDGGDTVGKTPGAVWEDPETVGQPGGGRGKTGGSSDEDLTVGELGKKGTSKQPAMQEITTGLGSFANPIPLELSEDEMKSGITLNVNLPPYSNKMIKLYIPPNNNDGDILQAPSVIIPLSGELNRDYYFKICSRQKGGSDQKVGNGNSDDWGCGCLILIVAVIVYIIIVSALYIHGYIT